MVKPPTPILGLLTLDPAAAAQSRRIFLLRPEGEGAQRALLISLWQPLGLCHSGPGLVPGAGAAGRARKGESHT